MRLCDCCPAAGVVVGAGSGFRKDIGQDCTRVCVANAAASAGVDSRQLAMTAADKAVARAARNWIAVASLTSFIKEFFLVAVRALAAATGALLCAADTVDRAAHPDP